MAGCLIEAWYLIDASSQLEDPQLERRRSSANTGPMGHITLHFATQGLASVGGCPGTVTFWMKFHKVGVTA